MRIEIVEKGTKYNRLTIIEDLGIINRKHLVKAKCECGVIKDYLLCFIKVGRTKSCGCFKKEKQLETFKKYNTYDLTGDYGIGYDCNNKEFYFDLEDYDKIKDYCWVYDGSGYFMTMYKNKNLRLHRVILEAKSKEYVDHINHDRHDNRKDNLRIVTNSENIMNSKPSHNGIKGISWSKRYKKWRVRLYKNGEVKFDKKFENIKDAINKRLQLEKEYFGEYRYAWENDINLEELLKYEKELKNSA